MQIIYCFSIIITRFFCSLLYLCLYSNLNTLFFMFSLIFIFPQNVEIPSKYLKINNFICIYKNILFSYSFRNIYYSFTNIIFYNKSHFMIFGTLWSFKNIISRKYENFIESRTTVNHKHEKVKEEVYLVSTNAPQRNISFRKPKGAHARIYSSSVLRSIPAALSLLFLLFFFLTCSRECVPMHMPDPLAARKKGHFTRYHSLPWWIPPCSGRT